MASRSEDERAAPTSLARPEQLRNQLEALHDASARFAALSLLPAIQVAWADGVILDAERRMILDFAEQEGVDNDPAIMKQIERWLDRPPTDLEIQEAIVELRALIGSEAAGGEREMVGKVVTWARAVAQPEPRLLGRRAPRADERNALKWLESAVDPERQTWARSGGVPSRRSRPDSLAPRLAIMRDLLVERMAAPHVEHVDYVAAGTQSLKPQRCPRDPERMPPAVLAVPEEDYRAYMDTIVKRYVRSLTSQGSQQALRIAARHAVDPVDDRELANIVWSTSLSRMLVAKLDPVDERRFSDVVKRAPRGSALLKLDLSVLKGKTPMPEQSMSPSVGLFALSGERLMILAIAVGERVFEPGDEACWPAARMFFLQGCGICLVVGVHPTLHFPNDTVVAVTRDVLSPAHPIARLINAHAYLQLPLNHGVRYNTRSVLRNDQREIYTPFPMVGDSLYRCIAETYRGVAGNSAYPGYRYPMSAPSFPGPYCRFLRAYYDVVTAFCRRVADHTDPADSRVAQWAAELHERLPGFPSPQHIREREVLARALSGFVHAVSVWHSADHHSYAQIPVGRIPHRLRIPVPTGSDIAIPTHEWVRPTDVFRQELARQMFYEAHTVRSLLEVDYGFQEPTLAAAAEQFADALRDCDRSQEEPIIALDRIACSIQF